ncbi:aldoxime dehydratase, partial [Fusarium napiforme]
RKSDVLGTRPLLVRDASSARPDAAASNHVMDVVKLARDAPIHGQRVIDLRVGKGASPRSRDCSIRETKPGGWFRKPSLTLTQLATRGSGLAMRYLRDEQGSNPIARPLVASMAKVFGNIAFLVLAIVSNFEGSKAIAIVSPIVEEVFVSTIPKIHLQSPNMGDLTLLTLIFRTRKSTDHHCQRKIEMFYWQDMSKFERVGRIHRGHVKLRKRWMEVYGLGEEMGDGKGQINLWEETSILRGSDIVAEYVECREGTGFMAFDRSGIIHSQQAA